MTGEKEAERYGIEMVKAIALKATRGCKMFMDEWEEMTWSCSYAMLNSTVRPERTSSTRKLRTDFRAL